MASSIFRVKVGGDYALFPRPEFPVERVTYPVMPPSAARGLLEAVYWKPEIRWEIRQIKVLKPIQQLSVMRNEISRRQADKPILIEADGIRQQRMSLLLKDVEYVIEAELRRRPHATKPLAGYLDEADRRFERGQCHHTPCLGMREFAAWFEPATGDETVEPLNMGIGLMLFDIAYCEDPTRTEDVIEFMQHGSNGRHVVKGYAEPIYFPAVLREGTLAVPRELYDRKLELERRHAS